MIDKIISHDVNTNKNRNTLSESFQNFNLNSSASSDGINPTPFHLNNDKMSDEEKKVDNLGKSIVKVTVLTTACVFIAMQGSYKKLRSKLDQVNKNIGDIDFLNTQGGKNKSIKTYIRSGARKLTSISKATFNLAPLKDVLLAKGLKKSKITENIANAITNKFEQISFFSLKHYYSNAHNKIEFFFADCDELKSCLPKEQLEQVKELMKTARDEFSNGFSETELRKRLTGIKNRFDGYDENRTAKVEESLQDKVWGKTYKDLKKFFKNSEYLTFVSEEAASKIKMPFGEEVNKHKIIISNSLNSICQDSYDLLCHLDTFISPKDFDVRKTIKATSNIIHKEKKIINSKTSIESELPHSINLQKVLSSLKKVLNNSTDYNEDDIQEASKTIDSLIKRLETPKRGAINSILDICQNYLPEEKYAKLFESGYNAVNALEKAVDMETDKMFDKVRDLKIGSAPKDVLLLLIPIGAVLYGLSKADSTQEKVSVGIKYGIPIVGAVAITMLCPIALISAGPSLVIGFLSGLALNQIGEVADDFIKKHSHNKS